jgi:hypothetical protein
LDKEGKTRLSIVKELLDFLLSNKLWRMIPMILVFILFDIFIVFAQNAAVAPSIYTLF